MVEWLTPQTLDLEIWDSSLTCPLVSLVKELYSTLSLFTQVYKMSISGILLGGGGGGYPVMD